MSKLISIPYDGKIKCHWDDLPENYSRESKNRLRNDFAKKYGVNKANINIIFRPVKTDIHGNVIEITGAGVDNIMDKTYQRGLMKEWYKREGKTVDFDRLMKLDDKVNGDVNFDNDVVAHRSWAVKWMSINNFLCFGEENFISFSKYKGLNIVTSEPTNQGGKTTFSVDAIKFLLFGKTTKTNKNEQIFNSYTDKNQLVVKGMIEYDGQEIIIERKLTRSLKKDGSWAVTNVLNYYEILPDGEEKPLNEEDAKVSTAGIKKTIGSEEDFDLTILATARNLEDLIDATPTDSGKLLTKFIGLEILEIKEKAVREMYNKFSKTKQSNSFDVVTLVDDIRESKDKIEIYNGLLETKNNDLDRVKSEILTLNNDRDALLTSKDAIDVVISQLNPLTLEADITRIVAKGKTTRVQVNDLQIQIDNIKNVDFSEEKYQNLTNDLNKKTAEKISLGTELERLEKLLDDLTNGEICPTCKRALEDVDHSDEIEATKSLIISNVSKGDELTLLISTIRKEMGEMKLIKDAIDEKNKLELTKDRLEVEIASLINDVNSKKNDLVKYKQNEKSITHNINVDSKVSLVKTNIIVKEREKDELVQKINTINQVIIDNNNIIEKNNIIIDKIKKEEEIEKIFKVYIEMLGKKGISKLVLRSVLPIINSELVRLMDEVCDFEIELVINSKNEVEYLIINDGIEKPLKSGSGMEKTISALAVRCVLGKMSHLPMPNFITLDEIISGTVSEENISKLKPMIDKIRDMFEIIFFVTHNDSVKDWGDNIITIKKTNHVSKIHTK